jgi:hypothetical protein
MDEFQHFNGKLRTAQRAHDEETDVTKKVALAAKLERMKKMRDVSVFTCMKTAYTYL